MIEQTKEKESAMKEVLHKERDTLNHRGKIISIEEHGEDSECSTNIRKNFIYILIPADCQPAEVAQPRIRIKKSFDTKSRDERFAFRIKGAFYLNRDRRLWKVLYCHSLKILLHWKSKVYSPKKSVTMA